MSNLQEEVRLDESETVIQAIVSSRRQGAKAGFHIVPEAPTDPDCFVFDCCWALSVSFLRVHLDRKVASSNTCFR